MFKVTIIALAFATAAFSAAAAPQESATAQADTTHPAQKATTAPADTTKAAPKAAMASEHVARAVFTTAVTDREPVDNVTSLNTDATKVYFFTEIVGMEGKTVMHRWIYNGETKAELSFTIGGPKWRVFSSKTLAPAWAGGWTVEVLDGDGAKLQTASFEYGKTP